jgi:cathepsin A (carboxypeptidase C)
MQLLSLLSPPSFKKIKMVSNWLSKASTAFICSLAISSSIAFARPPVAHTPVAQTEDAEQLHFDGLGNLVWPSSETVADAKSLFNNIQSSIGLEAEQKWAQAKLAAEHVGENILAGADHIIDDFDVAYQLTKDKAKAIKDRVHRMGENVLHETSVVIDGLKYQKLVHPAFPEYALRINQESQTTSCDPDVKSYSGYLDIGHDKHLWFAFFESRSRKFAADKSKEPIVMWLNGGPGCSSTTGWLMEGVGPCTIAKNGTAVKSNKFSWTNQASVFFLDQPVNVGYSYSDSGSVNNTPDSASDVYAFLNMFFAKFQEYADNPFSVAAESYGGRYAPLIASKIFNENKERKEEAQRYGLQAPKTINLESIMIGNGLTDPKVQFATVYDFACESEQAIFKPDSEECQTIKSKAPTCTSLIENCYKYDSRLTCLPAGLYCWSGMFSGLQNSGRNLYDVRKKCDRSPEKDGPLCYRDESYVETYLNQPEVKKSFGVPEQVEFQACNMNVNQAFLFNGDGSHNSAAVLPELLESGIRVLVYAGVWDSMCNYIGNVGDKSWALSLESVYQDELTKAKTVEWKVKGKSAGKVRQAGKGAGALTLVHVYEAGHMVPYDQPENAEYLIESWLANKAIA